MRQVGDECLKAYVPFLLDLLSYAIDESGTDSAEFAARRPDLTIRSAEEFSKPQYGVDILKLEFPADLKWTREFSNGAFDGKERPPAYHLAEVRQYCRQLNDASVAPWVILSAGVDIGPPEIRRFREDRAGAEGARLVHELRRNTGRRQTGRLRSTNFLG